MKSYNHIKQIDKCRGLSRKAFIDRYVKTSLPVVLCDMPSWNAFEKFTPDFFKANYGQVERKINGQIYTLDKLIDLSLTSTPENKSPYPIMFHMEKELPELMNDVMPDIHYDVSNRLQSSLLPKRFYQSSSYFRELFFGGKGCSFPVLHIDQYWIHTQITQIIGNKEFILYAPDQTPYVYPDKNNVRESLIKDINNPDYEKFPLFKNARALKVVVKPGETIFIPSGWWHTTYIHDFNLSFVIDHVNSTNWDIFMNDVYNGTKKFHPKLAWVVRLYQHLFGKIFKLQEYFIKLQDLWLS